MDKPGFKQPSLSYPSFIVNPLYFFPRLVPHGCPTVLYRKIIPDFWPDFWDSGFFRWDFRGVLEDFWGYVCRILGGGSICFSYSVGCFLGGF